MRTQNKQSQIIPAPFLNNEFVDAKTFNQLWTRLNQVLEKNVPGVRKFTVANAYALNKVLGMTGGDFAYQVDLGQTWIFNEFSGAWEKVATILS